MSCFEFKDGGILTQKSAQIGPGNFIKINEETEGLIRKISEKNEFKCQILRSDDSHDFTQEIEPDLCIPERRKISDFKKPGTIEASDKVEDSENEEDETETSPEEKKVNAKSIYKCPNDNCIKDYIKFKNYEKHLRDGICKMRLRKESQENHCKTMWFSKFGIQDSSMVNSSQYFRFHLEKLADIVLPPSIELLANFEQSPLLLLTTLEEILKMGYAMKANQKLIKIIVEVKDYVQMLFNQGQQSNQKYSPNDIVGLIHKKFPKENWLKFGQVKCLVSNMKAKVLAEKTDLEPEQLLKQAEDEINMEVVIAEVEKAKSVLNNGGDWLSSHPLEVRFL